MNLVASSQDRTWDFWFAHCAQCWNSGECWLTSEGPLPHQSADSMTMFPECVVFYACEHVLIVCSLVRFH